MILTLKKRDRALCLFNSDFLRQKVIEASEVLEALGDEDESEEEGKKEGREYPSPGRKVSESFRRIVSSSGGTDAPETPTKKPFSSTSAALPSPISPAHLAASKSIIAAPATPSSATASTIKSLKDLAPFPIIDILAYLRANDGLVPGIDKADEAKKREMDAFLMRSVLFPCHSSLKLVNSLDDMAD
jgi:polyadenylate-binding protein